jgi:hypothetical protein
MSCSDRRALAEWTGRAVQAANSTPGATSGNLHLVIRWASQMNQASDSAPGPTKQQEIEQTQALWARHDRMRGSRARPSLFYRDHIGLARHGVGGRILVRAFSAGSGAAAAVSASTVEADRGSLLVCEASQHETMRYVHPIVSWSRCVGRLGISDKENDRLSTALIELDACRMSQTATAGVEAAGIFCATSRATIRMNLKTSPGIRQEIRQYNSHRFVLTTTAQMLVKVLRGEMGFLRRAEDDES